MERRREDDGRNVRPMRQTTDGIDEVSFRTVGRRLIYSAFERHEARNESKNEVREDVTVVRVHADKKERNGKLLRRTLTQGQIEKLAIDRTKSVQVHIDKQFINSCCINNYKIAIKKT